MNHPGRKLKTELTIGIQKLLASLPQPGPLALINGTARSDRPADRDQRPIGRQGNRRRPQPVQDSLRSKRPRPAGSGSGPSCGRYRQNVTTQPSPATGCSTGNGSTLGKPMSLNHRVTCTDVASRATESGDIAGAIRATASAAGR